MHLKSKVVVVTGAASGIGREIARTFWVDGAKVAIADLNQAGAAAAAAELGDVDSAIGIGMDVTDETQVDAGMAAAVGAFGVSTCWSPQAA
jgi:3-hydroxybutyrate dehydrogenase